MSLLAYGKLSAPRSGHIVSKNETILNSRRGSCEFCNLNSGPQVANSQHIVLHVPVSVNKITNWKFNTHLLDQVLFHKGVLGSDERDPRIPFFGSVQPNALATLSSTNTPHQFRMNCVPIGRERQRRHGFFADIEPQFVGC